MATATLKQLRKLGIDYRTGTAYDRKRNKRKATPPKKNDGNPLFLKICEAHGLPIPVPEYQFASPRKWRADWAFPDLDVLLEIEGGVWTHGRHVQGAGFEADIEKYAEAACRGWSVLRVTPAMIEDGRAFAWLKRIHEGA